MLIIKIKNGEKIDHALKRLKNKFRNTKVLDELRKRKQFDKPSVVKRQQKQKAIYKQGLNLDDNY